MCCVLSVLQGPMYQLCSQMEETSTYFEQPWKLRRVSSFLGIAGNDNYNIRNC